MKFKLAESCHRKAYKALECKPLVIFLISFFFTHGSLFSQDQQSQHKTIHVKFKEHFKPDKNANGKTSASGLDKVDKVSAKHKALNISRIYPDAGVFEDAHRAYGLHLWYEIKFTEEVKLKNIIDDYRETDYFDNVEESRPYSTIHREDPFTQTSTLPSEFNDTYFSKQWHFKNTGQTGGTPGADINLLKAWQVETGSPNVVVAVIDGGISQNHPDLKEALWVNSDEIPSNGKDDDNNGYVDDVHGYGFGDKSSTIYSDNHATHVAGIIGALSNNGIGVSGIAGGTGLGDGVRLMTCATFGNFHIGGFEAAMVYAADNGAVISQNSWGGGSSAIEDAINYFINRAGYDNRSKNFSKNIQTGPMAGGVVIFAAGNSNTSDTYYGYPASYEKVIAVASTDHNDAKSYFSNYGTWVDISAPGTDIYSLRGSGYGYLSGTSMACPHVSGVAALIVSNLQRPGLKPSEVWNRLRLSSQPISLENPSFIGQLGWGRLDAYVSLMKPDAISPPPISDLHADGIHSSSLLLKWTATDEGGNKGPAAEYEIRFSKEPIDASNFSTATLLSKPPTPPLSGELVTMEIKELTPFTTYYFAIKSRDIFNNTSWISNVLAVTTLKPPIPEVITTHLSEQLYTGRISIKEILVKNAGEDELLVRLGVPNISPAPVGLPTGAKGRLFAINTSKNTIEELNIKTGTVIHSIPMPEPSSKTLEGLAFDGVHLYYGRSNKIYKINAQTGEIVRSFNLNNTSSISGLAWSGRYLYVSRYNPGSYSICEVDSDNGSILRSFDGYFELTFTGNNGTLIRGGNRNLVEINIQTGQVEREFQVDVYPKGLAYSTVEDIIFVSDEFNPIIKAIRPSDGVILYTLPYPKTTALAGDEYKFGWLENNEKTIAISGGETIGVPVSFIATGLPDGEWTGNVNVISVNSQTSPISVSSSLSVLSATDIETASELDFGIQYIGFEIDSLIYIENRGFSDLIVSNIQSNDSRVTLSLSSITLAPHEKAEIKLSVLPDGPGEISTSVIFSSNDPDEKVLTIPVRANVMNAPGISVAPDSLNVVLSSGDSTTVTFTVTNTGNSPLYWKTNFVGSDAGVSGQSSLAQREVDILSDSVYKTDLGEISLKTSSPEPLTCLSYDTEGGLIYAKAINSTNFYTYNPVTNQWTKIGLTPEGFYGQSAYLNGKLYHGGSQLNIYNIQSVTWSSVSFPVAGSALSLTSDDRYVYVALAKVLYRFDPVTNNWLELAPVPGPYYMTGFAGLSYHSGILYGSGTQAIMGSGNTLFFKYFIDSNTWLLTSSISGKATLGSAIDPSSGRYFVLGAPEALQGKRIQMSILDIREGAWSKLAIPFAVGTTSGLVYVGKESVSGVYFIEGEDGNKFGYYETEPAKNWLAIAPVKGNIPAGETQTIAVNLNAQGLFGGNYDGSVSVFSAKPPITVNVPLKLTVIGKPNISLSTLTADVGEIEIGRSRDVRLIIKNTGTSSLTIDSIVSNHSAFKLTPFIPLEIQIGESATIYPSFWPTSLGAQVGTFTFYSNSLINGNNQFVLKGTGANPAVVEMTPDSISVSILSGTILKQYLTVRNTGGATSGYDIFSYPSNWLKIFSYDGIAPGEEKALPITIDASGKSSGTYLAEIINNYSVQRVPVKMIVTSAPSFHTLDSIDFGKRFVNSNYDTLIQIKNNGVMPLLVSSVESDNPSFTISIVAPLNLNPDESVTAMVHFNPITLNPQIGNITFTTNDPDDSLFVMVLNGHGVDPPLLSASDSELIVSAYVNETQSAVIDIANNGGSLMKWKIIEESNPHPTAVGDFTSKASTPAIPFLGLTADPSSGVLYAHDYWSQQLYSYNAQSNQWIEAGVPLLYPEYNFQRGGAVILNSKMYCVYMEGITSIYVFDMILKSWTKKNSKLGSGTATITTDGTLLYIAGGEKFMSYNPKTNEWVDLPIPNFSLDGMGGLSYLDGVIFAHANGSNDFAKYTVATMLWENLPPLPGEGALGSTIDPVKKRYYAYGKNYLYEYDITVNVWTTSYFPLFEIGSNGALAYSSKSGYEGIYFLQGNTGKGFARYEPKTELGWLRSSHLIGEIESMEGQTIGINCNATNLTPGEYHGTVKISTNDPNNLTFDVPVTFLVKNPAPTIEMAALISDTISRANPFITKLAIKNDGRDLLEWSLANTLPPWFSVNKTFGSVSGFSADSIEVTFSPGLFTSGLMADYTLELNSNAPSTPKSSTRFMLTLLNHKPVLVTEISDQIIDSNQLEIPLLEHFTDPDNDSLSFSVSTNVNSIAFVNVVGSKLLISPINSGTLTVTVTASDTYNSNEVATFYVTNTITDTDNPITGIEQESGKPGSSVSPNPFKSKFKIQFGEYKYGKATVLLFDLTGRTILRSQEIDVVLQNELEIDGSNLPSGHYTCIIIVNNKLINSIRLLKD